MPIPAGPKVMEQEKGRCTKMSAGRRAHMGCGRPQVIICSSEHDVNGKPNLPEPCQNMKVRVMGQKVSNRKEQNKSRVGRSMSASAT